jgi:hypothetical protein
MKNRVQFMVGGNWITLGDYVTEERAIEVAKNFEKSNPGTRVRVVSSEFKKKG